MIDAQVHVFVKENLPDGNRMEFARRAARSRLPYRDPLDILPRVGRGTWDPGAEDLLQFMQDAKIDIAVNAVSEFGPCFGEEAEWDGWKIHEHAFEITTQTEGKVQFMCGVDPRRHDAMQSITLPASKLIPFYIKYAKSSLKYFYICRYFSVTQKFKLLLPMIKVI